MRDHLNLLQLRYKWENHSHTVMAYIKPMPGWLHSLLCKDASDVVERHFCAHTAGTLSPGFLWQLGGAIHSLANGKWAVMTPLSGLALKPPACLPHSLPLCATSEAVCQNMGGARIPWVPAWEGGELSSMVSKLAHEQEIRRSYWAHLLLQQSLRPFLTITEGSSNLPRFFEGKYLWSQNSTLVHSGLHIKAFC